MKQRTRASAVIIHNDQILTFRAVDPHNHKEYHFLPGGKVEPGETPLEAAARETYEETGFEIILEPSSAVDKEYNFLWNNEVFNCLTLFYRGTLKSPFQTIRSSAHEEPDYNKGVVWIPVLQAREIFSYTFEIRDAVLEILAQNSPV